MLVEEVFEGLVNGLLVEDLCGCIKDRLLEYGVCLHCGEVHGEEKTTDEYFGEDDVECGDCGKKMAANRFASHLEKCLSSENNSTNLPINSGNNNNKKRKQK